MEEASNRCSPCEGSPLAASLLPEPSLSPREVAQGSEEVDLRKPGQWTSTNEYSA